MCAWCCSEPLLILPGDRFIVRMFSPVVTIGGGMVLDIAPPRRAQADRLRILETAPLPERIALLARESRYGIGMPELVARTGLLEADLRKASSAASLTVLESPQFWLLDPRMGRRQVGSDARTFEAVPSAESPAGWSLERRAAQQVFAGRAALADGRAARPFQDTGGRRAKRFVFLLIKLH